MKNKTWTANQVKNLRGSLGITQAALGARCGVTENYIWMIEAGKKIPSPTLKLLLDCIDRDTKGAKP